MAHVVEDRILESTTTTGTAAITLTAAVIGFRRFSAVCAIGDTVPYFIEALDALGAPTGDYEYGVATYSAANQLTRTKVLGSSNGGAAVNFIAGTKNVGVAALGGSLVPTGAAFDMTGSTVPSGYVEADGQLRSRAQYPGLWAYAQSSGNIAASDAAWAAAEGQYSPGDGATTFRVPDSRGNFVRGWDHGRGVDAGRTIGSFQDHQFQDHIHDTKGAVQGAAGAVVTILNASGSATGTGTLAASGNRGTETRPRSIAWMKIIKT